MSSLPSTAAFDNMPASVTSALILDTIFSNDESNKPVSSLLSDVICIDVSPDATFSAISIHFEIGLVIERVIKTAAIILKTSMNPARI